MTAFQNKSPYNLDVYRDALTSLGWSPSIDQTEIDTVQEVVRDSKGKGGILLRINGQPGIFLQSSEVAIVDPVDIYESLVLGWNLEAWFTAVPGPHNLLRFYNTTYKPNKDIIVRGEENSVAEINLAEALDVDSAQRITGQFLLLSPDTWRSESYQQFLKSSTGQRRLTVDNSLLKDLQDWRLALVRNLYELYSDSHLADLDLISQKLLDEIIFIRFCEDRDLVEFENLFDMVLSSKKNDLLDRFCSLVGKYEDLFDTSLFDSHITDSMRPSVSILQAIIVQSVEFYKFDLLNVDLLGRIYEEYLSYEIRKDDLGISYNFKLEQRRMHGIYYTPSYIVNYLVKRAFHVFEEKHGAPLLVLDPSCGSGIFLTAFFKEFSQTENEINLAKKREFLENNIFGIDVDNRAVRRAAQSLYYTILTDEGKLKGKHLLPELLGRNLLVKDSLLDRKQLVPNKQFDIIISNPPYRRISGEQLSQYRELYNDVIFNQSDLCWLMLVAAIENVVEGGVVAFIVPDNVLRTSEYVKIRKFILENTNIVEISYLNYQAFESASLQNIILILRRKKLSEQEPHNILVNYFSTPGLFETDYSTSVEQSTFYNEYLDFVFNVQLTPLVYRIYKKIGDMADRVSDYFGVSQGIKPNRQDLYDIPIQKGYKRYLFGKDIQPYSVNWSGKYIDYDAKRNSEDRNIRLREAGIFEVPVKLIIRKIVSSRLVVAIDFEKYFVDSAGYVLSPRVPLSNDELYIILAILSSKIVRFYYQVEYPERKTSFPQIRGKDIEHLPISLSLLREKPEIYNGILALSKRLYSNVKAGDILPVDTYNHLDIIEIDDLLSKLYSLTEEEKAVVEGYII